MIYAYARVSTTEQKLDRQLEEFKKYNVDKVYSEKQSGKDFNSRKKYQALKNKVKKGDTIIILSIDRLGRNYQEILEEWRYLTEKKQVKIKVLDAPMLDMDTYSDVLLGKFISNLILQIFSYFAEVERRKIKERQTQGIKIAKEKGTHFGRPKAVLPPNSNEILDKYINKEINNIEAAKLLGISRETFFRLVKKRKEKESK